MTVLVLLGAGAGAGCPLQHMEEAAATVVVSWLDMGCWRRGGGDVVCAFQDGEEVGTTTVPYFRIAVGSCRWRGLKTNCGYYYRHHRLRPIT